MRIVFAALLIWSAAIAEGAADEQIVLKVIGPDGEPLAKAKIHNRRSGKEYTCDKNGLLSLTEEMLFRDERQRKGILLYGLYEDKLAGFFDVKADDLGKELEMKLTPACRVYGSLKSTELTGLGQKLDWTNVYALRNNDWAMSYASDKGDFEFLLPSGKYKLIAYGRRTYDKYEDIGVAPGQKELKINFDLPADRLAHLIGKEAPDLQQIKGWLNAKPLSLKNLRGKVVLLDFWGTWCGPCISAIPDLIELHEKYHDKGLVIIGVHDDSKNSIKDLEKEISKLSKERWNGKHIPFALALDGGGRCKIEGIQQTASGATTAAYGINSFPTVVLIDKQGNVVNQYHPGRDAEMLEKLLNANVGKMP
jgi:thiol-disulfide isomerase/thioredoxin